MKFFPDDESTDLELSADAELRRMTIVQAVTELAMARAQEIDDAQVRVYTLGLLDVDLDLVVAACRTLGLRMRQEGETALPSVGDIRARCWQIRAEEKRREDERAYAETYRHAPVPNVRPDILAWVKASMEAISADKPRPPRPVLLESSTVTYHCHACRDTGWMQARDHTVQKCFCKPQAAPIEPVEVKPKARAHKQPSSWRRIGE